MAPGPATRPCPEPSYRRTETTMRKMGPYDLLEVIGRGGMGTVYRGRHRGTGLTVAVKVMNPETAADPVLLRRFEQEFAAASRLHHPHVVRGLDFGLEDGRPYMVM